MNRFPSPDDYAKAVQHPESFVSDELRGAVFAVDRVWQVPRPAAGTSAVVFKAVVDGDDQALRFFIRPDAATGARYAALQEHFAGHGLTGCVASSRWMDHAIRVNGATWPVLRMQWVNGRALNQHVDELVERDDTRAIGDLARDWRNLVLRLQRSEFAHGDLQHGNVLIDETGAMRLVDFDCSWIARFAGSPAPTETGQRNYQLDGRPWGPWMDTFPALVVYTSLVALSKNTRPWQVLDNGENMLFCREDFVRPGETRAWQHLSAIRDDELELLAARLKECCTPGWAATGGIDDLLAPRTVPWWERTGPARDGAAPVPPVPPVVPSPRPRPGPRTDPVGSVPPVRPAPAGPPTGEWWERLPGAVRPEPEPVVDTPPAGQGRDLLGGLGVGVLAAIVAAGARAAPGLVVVALLVVWALVYVALRLRRTPPRSR